MTPKTKFAPLLAAVLLAGCYSDLQQPPTVAPKAVAKKVRREKAKRVQPEFARRRTFQFVYETAVVRMKPGTKARIWVPLAESNPFQSINVVSYEPADATIQQEEQYGNRFFYVEATADDAGRIPIRVAYNVSRFEALPRDGRPIPFEERQKGLRTDAIPGVDKCFANILKGEAPIGEPDVLARKMYDVTIAHLGKEKPSHGPWGQGDAGWASEAKAGDSVDLHSVFVALCRGVGLPARIEFGFVLPPGKESGEIYEHRAWAWFAGERWTAVDLCEARDNPEQANYWFGHLSQDRIAFTTGRDLTLTPSPAAGKVNFVINPYVEVAGKPYAEFEHHFTFEKQEEAASEDITPSRPGEE